METKKRIPEEEKATKLTEDEIEQISGGSALDDVPVVDEHDYDE